LAEPLVQDGSAKLLTTKNTANLKNIFSDNLFLLQASEGQNIDSNNDDSVNVERQDNKALLWAIISGQ